MSNDKLWWIRLSPGNINLKKSIMNKVVPLICIVWMSCGYFHSFGQHMNFGNIDIKDSVRLYYYHSSRAENFILEEKPDSSLKEYLKAFTFKSSFFRDRRNARKVLEIIGVRDSVIINRINNSGISSLSRNPALIGKIDSIFNLDQTSRMRNSGIAWQDSLNTIIILDILRNHEIS